MSEKNEIGSTIQITRKLINHLPKEMNDELKRLILRADNGQDTTREIIKLLSPHENIRHWVKEQIDLLDGQDGATRGYVPLAGNHSASFSQKWNCPQIGCAESLPVIQEGEDPPVCEQHKIEMVRGNAGKENRHAR